MSPTPSWAALSAELAAAVERAAASVVAVGSNGRGAASGVLWRPGVVVTTDRTLRTSRPTVFLPDGRAVRAEVAGRDPGVDLAALRLDEAEPPAAPVGLEDLRVGSLVLAVARDPEDGVGASMGVVSALSGPWDTWRGGRLDHFLQPDLALYGGFSGGALADVQGRILGVNTTGLSRSGARTIPAQTVDRVLGDLLEKGRVARPYAGVSLHPVDLPSRLVEKLGLPHAEGVMVLGVQEDGPADRAGVLPGDVLLAVDGEAVADVGDLVARFARASVGQTVALRVLRGGEAAEVPVALEERPNPRGGCEP